MYSDPGRGVRHLPVNHHWSQPMNSTLLKLCRKVQDLKNGQEGQDLVEYALLVALIALVCVTGVSNVASAINAVFSNISASLS
jgi:pilus assembly protein Flp/PilA